MKKQLNFIERYLSGGQIIKTIGLILRRNIIVFLAA